ncbi:MAG: DNA primase [bacterium]
MISEEVLEKIYERCSLVDLVGQYVSLKKRGKNFIGLCPFHEEKTPSFTINPEKQLFYCFGCGSGGNIFSFLQKKENLSFIEAVKTLASSLNIKIEESSEKYDVFYKINEKASDFYSSLLFKDEGKLALNYLLERGLKKEVIEEFRLGIAPLGWDRLKNYLKKLYSENDLFDVGLLQKGKDTSYDWTRNRITFPIFDRFNRIVGFGARALDTSLPKYINTKETQIYNKSYILYGLNKAIPYIKEKNEVILVEGYIDVLMCHQEGFKNVVATCGTSLTEGHISAIKQAENVVVSFDPDKAGISAAERGVSLLINKGFEVFVISLDKMDPAELLKEKKGAFLNALKEKMEFFDFLVRIAREKKREEGIRYLLPFIEKIDDVIKRSLFIKKVSEALFIDEETIKSCIKKKNTKPMEYITKRKEKISLAEKLLISLMLEDEEIAVWAISEQDKELLKDKDCREIFEAIKEAIYSKEGYHPERLVNSISKDASLLASSLSMETNNKEDRYVLALSCIKRIKEESLKEKMQILKREIMEKEKRKENVENLLSSYQELAKNIEALRC